MPAVVVDAGRLHWLIGRAGEDSPDTGMPHSLQGAYDPSVFPSDPKALRQRRMINFGLLEEYERALSISYDGDDEDAYDGTAVISTGIFEDADSEYLRWLLDRVFARDRTLRFEYVHVVLQEALILYSSGRTTGLVINLGHDLTVVGVYDGYLLGETARRVPMTASEDAYLVSKEDWDDSVGFTALVTSAVMSAPIDTRRALLQSVVIGGGRWGGWTQLKSHLQSRLEAWLAARCSGGPILPAIATHLQNCPPPVKVIQPPEARGAVWLGGSVLGSIMRTRVPYLTADIWRARQQPRGGEAEGDTPPHLLRQDSGPQLQFEAGDQWTASLLPTDRPAWEAAARARALALVHAAPSLCAKLPAELCAAIADVLLEQSGLLSNAELRATAHLPPRDDSIYSTVDAVAQAAAALSALSLDAAAAGRAASHAAGGRGEDDAVREHQHGEQQSEDEAERQRGLRVAHEPCIAELRGRQATWKGKTYHDHVFGFD